MGLLDIFTLEKLRISAFDTADRSGAAPDDKVFEAMFNPATYALTLTNVYSKQQGVGTSGNQLKYQKSEPSDLSLDLVLDGTGVDDFGIVSLIAPKTVTERLQNFLDVCYTYNGAIHEPNYLLVEWGILSYPCRLSSVTVKFTTFDSDGTPLRAELALKLAADFEDGQRAKAEEKQSPDLTHSRVVKSGDTLPLLTKQIYGSPAAYLDVARFNGLNDFRSLTPGMEILFPPLVTFGRSAPKGKK